MKKSNKEGKNSFIFFHNNSLRLQTSTSENDKPQERFSSPTLDFCHLTHDYVRQYGQWRHTHDSENWRAIWEVYIPVSGKEEESGTNLYYLFW